MPQLFNIALKGRRSLVIQSQIVEQDPHHRTLCNMRNCVQNKFLPQTNVAEAVNTKFSNCCSLRCHQPGAFAANLLNLCIPA